MEVTLKLLGFSPVLSVKQNVQKVKSINIPSDCKTKYRREQTHPTCLHTVEKYENLESINTQNDYKTTIKKWTDKKKTNLCLKVFKFQNNKFKIVQKNLQEIVIKISWKTHRSQWSLHEKYGWSKAEDCR